MLVVQTENHNEREKAQKLRGKTRSESAKAVGCELLPVTDSKQWHNATAHW